MRIIVQCKHRQSANAVCADNVVDELLRARERYGVQTKLVGVTNAKASPAPCTQQLDCMR